MRYLVQKVFLVLTGLNLMFFYGCSFHNFKEYIAATGVIEATEIDLAPKIGGIVDEMLVEEGTKVAKGDTLAIIDHQTIQIQLRGAEAGIEAAKAKLQLLINGARSEEIKQAEAGLKQVESNLKIAQEDFNRTQSLFANGSATQKQIDDIRARYDIASAQYTSAEANLQKLQKFARPEEIRSAQAGLEQALATRDLLQKTLSDCHITAPMAGFITEKSVETGEFVNPGGTILTLTILQEVYLTIYIPEAQLGKVKLQQKAEIKIDSHPNQIFPGQVIYISPSAEFTPKNIQTKEDRVKSVFAVKIALSNPEFILKPGMPADAKIFLSEPGSDKGE